MSFRRAARSLLHTALLITVPTAAAGAQEATTTVIRAARLIVGDGTVIDQPAVVVRGDRIVEAGPASRVTVPRGAKVIELAGHTLLPGFIDTHTHLTSIDSDGGDLAAIQETAAHAGIWAAVNARKTLDAGFTAVREAGAPGFADVAAKSAIARGIIPGPRIFAAGAALGILGGHADVNGYSPEVQLPGTGTIVNGVDEVRQTVRHHVKYGADQIKIVATGGILSQGDAPTASQFSDAELREAVSEAARLGRKVMAHAHGGAGLTAAVEAGVASIEHGSLVTAEQGALMKQKGTYLVPTLIILEEIVKDGAKKGYPPYAVEKAKAIAAERRTRLRAAFQAGVPFAFGTDATSDIHGRNGEEFHYMVEILGATPMQAILSATRDAAALIGISRDAGSVTTGKWADIVAVEGNPLDDVRRLEKVTFVMKGGAVYKSGGK
ncbi:amidohydrolase family protein [Gemmatimonas sp.]|jgi:imidazolonepropionase-like amidohydrolase|uniref:metal-dependent hydrolase family protein n=1 Tax=Gemmatimonas sp. TaxID=1962908 RepID=UPI0037BFA449